jgi:hypothetical protein
LVVITGQPANISMAVQLLHHVGEKWPFSAPLANIGISCLAIGTGEGKADESRCERNIKFWHTSSSFCNLVYAVRLAVQEFLQAQNVSFFSSQSIIFNPIVPSHVLLLYLLRLCHLHTLSRLKYVFQGASNRIVSFAMLGGCGNYIQYKKN